MSIFCSLWGCKNTIQKIMGERGDYVTYKCDRCRKEIIFCAKESKTLDNNDEGRKILGLMMTDPEFSRQCTIHSEFCDVEYQYPFNYKKQDILKNQIRERYSLPEGFVQPDPVILYQKGLWRPEQNQSSPKKKAESKKRTASDKIKGKSKSKQKPEDRENGFNPNDGENYDNVVKVEIRISNRDDKKDSDNKGGGEKYQKFIKFPEGGFGNEELSVEAQITRLERRMNKHVSREEYEKAAKIRDMITKLKGGSNCP